MHVWSDPWESEIKLREAQRRQADRRVCAVLKAHSQADARPRAVARFDDFSPDYRKKIEELRGYALRAPEDWRCRIKSRSEERRFIDLIRFSFARYRVAPHLEQVWIDEVDDDFVDQHHRCPTGAMRRAGQPDLRRWYLIAAQGGSLYKLATHPYLSKLETHHFLTAPAEVASLQAGALVRGRARADATRKDVALKVAQSKIANYSIASSWWKEVARFFARNPTSVAGDGRSRRLPVRRQAGERGLLAQGPHARDAAPPHGGLAPRAAQEPGDRRRRLGRQPAARRRLRDRQRSTAGRSGASARSRPATSCSARASACITASPATSSPACSGIVSIWSLTCEFPIGHVNRGVTMEVTKDGRIVQCRGFANRLPYANEVDDGEALGARARTSPGRRWSGEWAHRASSAPHDHHRAADSTTASRIAVWTRATCAPPWPGRGRRRAARRCRSAAQTRRRARRSRRRSRTPPCAARSRRSRSPRRSRSRPRPAVRPPSGSTAGSRRRRRCRRPRRHRPRRRPRGPCSSSAIT